jgi:hypothetical protein
MQFRNTDYTGKVTLHTTEEFLLEVNRDRSAHWTDYTVEDAQQFPQEIIDEWMNDSYNKWEIV